MADVANLVKRIETEANDPDDNVFTLRYQYSF